MFPDKEKPQVDYAEPEAYLSQSLKLNALRLERSPHSFVAYCQADAFSPAKLKPEHFHVYHAPPYLNFTLPHDLMHFIPRPKRLRYALVQQRHFVLHKTVTQNKDKVVKNTIKSISLLQMRPVLFWAPFHS